MKGSEVLVALVAGLATVAITLLVLPFWAALGSGYLIVAAIAIAVIDARHFIIPNRIVYPAMPVGVAVRLLLDPDHLNALADCIIGGVVGGGSFYLMRLAYRSFRGREGLGLGDVKLAAAAGIWLGPAALPYWVLTACCAALLSIAAARMLHGAEKITATTAIPFGTFLAPALWLVWTLQWGLAARAPALPYL